MSKVGQVWIAIAAVLFGGNSTHAETLVVDLKDVVTLGSQGFAQNGDDFGIVGVVAYDGRERKHEGEGDVSQQSGN